MEADIKLSPELQRAIDEIEQTKEMFDKIVEAEAKRISDEEGLEVKPEEFDQEKIIYDQVTDIVVEIFKNPEVGKAFSVIGSKIGKDEALALINVITIACTNAAAGSIMFYDNLLREKLNAEYKNISHHINILKTETEGYYALSKLLRKKVGDIENHLQISKFKSEHQIGEEG